MIEKYRKGRKEEKFASEKIVTFYHESKLLFHIFKKISFPTQLKKASKSQLFWGDVSKKLVEITLSGSV